MDGTSQNITMTATSRPTDEAVLKESPDGGRMLRKPRPNPIVVTILVLFHLFSFPAPFLFSWSAFAVFAVLAYTTGILGISLSFHRNLSHRSFTLPKWLEYLFAYLGVLALQGDPIAWVRTHRYHHQHTDTEQDIHTPAAGFWHGHVLWAVYPEFNEELFASKPPALGDLTTDWFYQLIAYTYVFHTVLLAVGLLYWGGLPFLVWGLFLRVVVVFHVTWLVNSAAHLWGPQSWQTRDQSRNNVLVGFVTAGEWHNNHHAFEYSARTGLEWWQLDFVYYIVKGLEFLGLATKVKTPRKEHMARLRKTQ